MVTKIEKKSGVFLLLTTIGSLLSFTISSLIGAVLVASSPNIFLIALILTGGLGGLLLGLILKKYYSPLKLALTSTLAVSVGFMGAFMVAEALGLLLGMLGLDVESDNLAGIGNIIAIILMGVLCGIIFGVLVFGKKSLLLFAVVGGVVALPAGILVGLFNEGHAIRHTFADLLAIFGNVDLNMIVIIIALGLGIGLSMGLYELRR